MLLLFLTLALVGPYALLTLAERVFPSLKLERRTRAKVGVSALLLITASGHFLQADAMKEMLPPFVPGRLAIIYVTGVFELLGAIGIWIPRVEKLAGACLVLMLIGVLPSNVYSAFNHVPFGGHEAGPAYLLVRVPFQLLLIAWIYVATGQAWLRAHHPAGHGVAPTPSA
ncbi:MAG TPA: hypothetical protein VHG51_14720 [Longimicrobiaceae bacterium]|nr:hypothetical protein [Longimicrobiaceae bacterium]